MNNYKYEPDIKKISEKKGSELINSWIEGKEIPQELYYFKSKNVFIAIDNSSNNCWVEEFRDIKNCMKYLNGEALEDCLE